ncbi:MAG TPA: hypothetical protein ENJ95_16925 [Bacteroidetes bacterium]|nr:hypothetical protein [Bacteroidota bacterium]
MRSIKIIIASSFVWCLFATSSFAYYNPKEKVVSPHNQSVSFREPCTTSTEGRFDQDINNVRARLNNGGDVWWNRSDGKYVIPKVEPGQTEVSSIFAGAVWLGGFDTGGNLKVACQTYGNGSSQSDFWAGPLDDETGNTDKVFCDRWDRMFIVTGEEIKEHIRRFEDDKNGIAEYTEDMIPKGVKGWPSLGNPYFFSEWGFELRETSQGYAGFHDLDGDLSYNPLNGDYPIIEIRGCEEKPPQYPDQMIFWIYNDEGGGAVHGETGGLAIRMEVQVQAFAYATADEINNMTFQRYKLINRAKEDIDSTYFAMWVDADLGCFADDFIGSDTTRDLAYTYNADAFDGDAQCDEQGTPGYGSSIPIIGIDYFRGPRNEFREELGMSSFTYFNNPAFGNPSPEINTTDPSIDVEFYNYLSGSWRDGTPYTFGGDGFDPTSTNYINYAFTDAPDSDGWSMCNPTPGDPTAPRLPEYDRRTVQASGPFKLQPGAVNELIIGAVWVPDLDYPCPSITSLEKADDIAQDLFDGCFDILDGPDAPDIDWIELDQELIAVLTNKETSNNYLEQYEETGIGFPQNVDSTYNFEGYIIYQLAYPNVDLGADLGDPTKILPIIQVDVNNGISTLYNWKSVPNPSFDPTDPNSRESVWFPEVQVEGMDQGIRHTFSIKQDQFATSDPRLVNHKRYYFTVLAYAHNDYSPYDLVRDEGQRTTFVVGRNNVKTYKPLPRPIIDRELNAKYGDGTVITRLDGVGAGEQFLDISDETRAKILDGSFDGEITYKAGRGPLEVVIYNPLDVVDGEYELTFIDENMNNSKLDDEVFWMLTDLNSGETIQSDFTLDKFNEQIFGQYGFTVNIGQSDDVGDWADPTDGAIGYELDYASADKPFWFSGIQSGFSIDNVVQSGSYFSFVKFREQWDNRHHEVLGSIGPGYFVPYQICEYEQRANSFLGYLTPAWRDYPQGNFGGIAMSNEDLINDLNNVDIVFTSNKDLWSRCVVLESMPPEFRNGQDINGEPIKEENIVPNLNEDIGSFDLRGHPSVGKEADADGNPMPDGDGFGMGWFPGYAIDVETGKRLNIFFSENSAYRPEIFGDAVVENTYGGTITGGDMMFNPDSRAYVELPGGGFNAGSYYAGGQHWTYVTNTEYDACEAYRQKYKPGIIGIQKVGSIRDITWAGLILPQTGQQMLSYKDGLIPNDVTVKLRVDNPYQVEVGTGEANGYNTYRFKIDGQQASELDQAGVESSLDRISVVPNPYYADSEYEENRLTTIVKITNLPAKCVVTIYSLDGKFIRQYDRDETPGAPTGSGIRNAQILPDLEWDLKNSKGINIASGIYLIHVDAPEGERTLKWFGVSRRFDPSGL